LRKTRAMVASTAKQKTMMYSRFQVTKKPPVTLNPPVIHDGLATSLLGAPKIVRTSCWRMRLMPQVDSRVSSGRP